MNLICGQTCEGIGMSKSSSSNIMSVSVSSLKEEHNRFSKVYVGTEPSVLCIKLPGGRNPGK